MAMLENFTEVSLTTSVVDIFTNPASAIPAKNKLVRVKVINYSSASVDVSALYIAKETDGASIQRILPTNLTIEAEDGVEDTVVVAPGQKIRAIASANNLLMASAQVIWSELA